VAVAESQLRAACNLIIYILARTSASARTQLASLERTESDPFLKNAILWALSHLGDNSALTEFVNLYRSDSDWRSISRGYVLYYYGDVPVTAGPPYRDDPPYVQCDKAIEKVIEMVTPGRGLTGIAPQRAVIDLVTLMDIIEVRETHVASQVLAVLDDAISQIELASLGAVIVQWLREQHTNLIFGLEEA
jgi:hypothetical protein